MGVGQNIAADNANWTFGGNVPDTFVDHIKLSVPLYEMGHGLICQVSDFFVRNDSLCYEIGTSTGELIRKLAEHNSGKPDARWIGIDVEPEMVKVAEAHCADVPNITILHDDARHMEMDKADLIVSYYTMQFVPPRYRQELFNKIYQSLNWGGAFVMFEKVRGPDARFQDIMTQLYNEFKISNGFSSEEIVEKSRSLKSVLEPFSTQGNLDLLARAGFADVTSIQKYICFEGFLAIK
ncbi:MULTISPECIES: methyltransferase domain-containing protein [unclassified Ruegeria]|uniref:methyltransferase domain-containing protein n=1 Tax=unclassified Ruegeria TaxID=2625375 RepID=UPI001490DFC5|nr:MULTISPECIES: methyltransferase domain-containing protein [unclassified Ruegeria]NOD49783.1 methyltransferase domain-containing protein [Ruegeria sp. HKCCD5849]NOD54115.1 methyltransferase domain-containing protein [Ruegeria sp. HKCCD5851]NOD70114.1 methyltransferase domain-containing protein [Ruegeria sp. HKCCD7303]